MVEISKKTRRIINDYIQDVNKLVPISMAFLYGSYAKGNYDELSDKASSRKGTGYHPNFVECQTSAAENQN